MRANPAIILGHTDESFQYHPHGIGEIIVAKRVKQLMERCFENQPLLIDLYTFFEDFSSYECMAQLNYSLAERSHSLLEALPSLEGLYQRIKNLQPSSLLLLSWCWGMAATWATGIQNICPTIGKLYVFHSNERVIAPLYAPCDVIVTECLLAHEKGAQYGIPLGKMLYLPHQYPVSIDTIAVSGEYVFQLAEKLGKKLPTNFLTVGVVSRFEPRKNLLDSFQAVQNVVERGIPLVLIWKGGVGDIAPEEIAPLKEMIDQPWFLWDPEPTPHALALAQYKSFDFCLHLSGYEGASNVVVELLALEKPTIVLEGTTNPYLFRDGAIFIKNTGEMFPGPMPYQKPDRKILEQAIEELALSEGTRIAWGKRAKKIARERFHPRLAHERLPLLLEAAKSFRAGDHALESALVHLYEEDLGRHGL